MQQGSVAWPERQPAGNPVNVSPWLRFNSRGCDGNFRLRGQSRVHRNTFRHFAAFLFARRVPVIAQLPGIAIALIQPGWAAALFLFAPLVTVPLGLALITATDRHITCMPRWRAIGILRAADGSAVARCVCFAGRSDGGRVAVPWLLVTSLIVLAGMMHSWPWKQRTTDELCTYGGMAFVAVGGDGRGWRGRGSVRWDSAISSCWRRRCIFTMQVLSCRSSSGRRDDGCRDGWRITTTAGVIIGVPLTSVGITLSAFEVRWPGMAGRLVPGRGVRHGGDLATPGGSANGRQGSVPGRNFGFALVAGMPLAAYCAGRLLGNMAAGDSRNVAVARRDQCVRLCIAGTAGMERRGERRGFSPRNLAIAGPLLKTLTCRARPDHLPAPGSRGTAT